MRAVRSLGGLLLGEGVETLLGEGGGDSGR